MLEILMLSIILSIDALSFGISYGANKIILPLKSALIITVTGFVIILLAMEVGNIMYSIFSFGKFIGGLILIGMGIFIAGDFRSKKGLKTIISHPEKSDKNSNGNIENINYTQLPKLFMKDTSLFTSYGMAIALDMQENLNNYCKVSQNTDGSITATLDISTDESKVIADHIFNAGTMIQTLDIHSNMKKDKTSYTNISTLNGSINLGFFQVNINSNIKTSLQNTNDISIY